MRSRRTLKDSLQERRRNLFNWNSTGILGPRPSLVLNFIEGFALDPRITFARVDATTCATRVNSSGLLETVAANVPRFDYDPVTLAAKGLLIEETRTNLLLNSVLAGTNLATQSVTVTAVAHTLSFYGTGTVTLSGTSTGSLVGSGAYPTRSILTFTPTAGSLTLTVTGTVQFAQLEIGSFPTSYIPTAASAVTRAADSALVSGTNFSSWYNESEGTFVVGAVNQFVTGVANKTWLNVTDAGLSNRITGNITTAGKPQQFVISGGSTVVNLVATFATLVANTPFKTAIAYKVNDFGYSVDGQTTVTDTLGAVPVAPIVMRIGGISTTNTPFNGHIRQVSYYNTRLTDAELQRLSV